MALTVPAAMRAQILTGATFPVLLVYVDWPGSPVRVHSGVGTLSWDSQTWTGVNGFGGVTLPPNALGIAQSPGALKFGGLPEVIDAMLGADTAGRRVTVWWGCLTGRTPAPLVSDPLRIFTGVLDQPGDELDWQAGTHTGVVSMISGPSQLSTANPAHTFEDQQLIDATDTAGRLVRAAQASQLAQVSAW